VSGLRNVLVPTASGAQIPLGQLAELRLSEGPSMIKSENARPNAWVFVDLEPGVDVGSYVRRAQERVARLVALPPGYSIRWSGQYEYLERAGRRLRILVPVTVAVIFLLLFLHFRRVAEVLVLMATLPFALVGAVWLMALLGFNMSIAVAVGFIAVAGLAAETGVVMLVYLDQSVRRYRQEGRLTSKERLGEALAEGAVLRVRPLLMTAATTILGLLPVMFGSGTGAEVMKRIAAPMVGGLISSAFLTLELIPVVYTYWRYSQLRRAQRRGLPLAQLLPERTL
jgi:Cu(I)/Ag(I) efflux system membrane protein CusA/SilA